jgi:hypothetical protein
MLIRGSCHCRNITFSLRWDPDPVEIPARACTCTFCAKHGGVWTSNPKTSLRVAIEDPAQVNDYVFGTGTAKFHICTRCGVVPVVTSSIEGRTYAVVSVNAFENVDPALLKRAPATFDGESQEARLGRRTRNWIADVEFETHPRDLERELYDLELKLMRPARRAVRTEIEELLAEDFMEFGSSGVVYDREAMIAALAGEPSGAWSIADFKARALTRDAALVTYVAMMAGGKSSIRCSVWRREGDRWKMAFHQGTPK